MTVKELYNEVRDGHIISDIELQREIIYSDEKQRLVIDSIVKDYPLPAFYLWKNDDGNLEVLDGKQRIHAITRFYENDLEYEDLLWKEWNKKDPQLQERINDTTLCIIISEGTEEKKREIFNRINTLGVPLSEFEVLNGLYAGQYLRGLSKYVEQDSAAKKILGEPKRGKSKIKLLDFICSLRDVKDKKEYVKLHQNEPFVIDQTLVTKHVKFVASIFDDFSSLPVLLRLAVKYAKDITIWKENKDEINHRIKKFKKSQDYKLISNKEQEIEDIIQTVVQRISVDPRRLFSPEQKEKIVHLYLADPDRHKENKIRCEDCKHFFYEDELTVDHIEPWSKGGRTELSNAQLLCRPCNSKQGNRK
ncbi:MAG: DUF262 domain-containing protein [Muribaculaceae bacterium]|nr:DUF262 domain-containing protein [Muribaculaceae bacterium]